nr:immunoglobulin heavy chain junction region [Macaca mulatta]
CARVGPAPFNNEDDYAYEYTGDNSLDVW